MLGPTSTSGYTRRMVREAKQQSSKTNEIHDSGTKQIKHCGKFMKFYSIEQKPSLTLYMSVLDIAHTIYILGFGLL